MLLAKILLLPGFEFTATFGFHILAIFPETTSIRMMEHSCTSACRRIDLAAAKSGRPRCARCLTEVLDEHGAMVIGAHVELFARRGDAGNTGLAVKPRSPIPRIRACTRSKSPISVRRRGAPRPDFFSSG